METRSNHVLVGSIVLVLLVALALFTVWIARLGGTAEKEYDIFFKQAVDGLNKGSPVTYSGVPAGQVKDIALWKPDPQFVRVRVTVRDDIPVLQGTAATVQGVGFTGVSQVSLDGGRKGAPELKCPEVNPQAECPYGVPAIPTRVGGVGAILASAPQLLERLTTLTERLSEVLSDRNQASIAGILESTNRLSDALADRAPEIAATLAQTRIAIEQAGNASQQIGELAATTNGLIDSDVRPAMRNLNQTITAARGSADALNAAIGEARPGLTAFSKQTIPEVGQLVRDLREMAAALSSVAQKVDRQGVLSIAGEQKLPDYNGKK